MASVLLTKELAREAVELVLPSINAVLDGRGKRRYFHIVILDPTVKPWNGSFEDAILYEYSIRKDEWDNDYDSVARSKAYQSWRSQGGYPNLIIQEMGPASLQAGDRQGTSSFEWYGLIVAGSGIQGWLDFMIAGWVALACQMLAREEAEKLRSDPKKNSY